MRRGIEWIPIPKQQRRPFALSSICFFFSYGFTAMRISRYAHSLTISRSKSLASLSESEEPESDLLHMKKKKFSFIVAEMYSMYLVQDFGPIWIRIQGYTSLKEKKKNNFWETISFKKSTGIFFTTLCIRTKCHLKKFVLTWVSELWIYCIS